MKREVNKNVIKSLAIFTLIFSIVYISLGGINITDTRKDNSMRIKELISKLDSNSLSEQKSAIWELHKLGKEAIPFLIKDISNENKSYVLLANPLNSDLEDTLGSDNYKGVLSAYIIELILNKDDLGQNVEDNKFLLGESSNYIYWKGIIKKNGKPISNKDLTEIKEIYSQWWKNSCEKSIDTLRIDRKDGSEILNGKPYSWK